MFPIYGEKYIERSLRSLLDQTLEDIEFILVDDRSPDSAYEKVMRLLEEGKYAHLKDNVKIIRHDVNKGVHVVRRTGWEASSGDYIYYMDSDDWLDLDMLRKLWEKAEEGGYDLVECSLLDVDDEGNSSAHPSEILPESYEDWVKSPFCYSLCNKLVKRNLFLKGILWPQNPYLDDYVISRQLYFYSEKRFYLDEMLYHYYQHPSSIMHSAEASRRVKGKIGQDNILESFIRSKGMYEKYRTYFTVTRAKNMVEAWYLPREEFLRLFPQDRLKVLLCRSVPLEERLGILTKLLGIHGIRGKKRS